MKKLIMTIWIVLFISITAYGDAPVFTENFEGQLPINVLPGFDMPAENTYTIKSLDGNRYAEIEAKLIYRFPVQNTIMKFDCDFMLTQDKDLYIHFFDEPGKKQSISVHIKKGVVSLSNPSDYAIAPTVVTYNKFHRLTVVLNIAKSEVNLYINGKLEIKSAVTRQPVSNVHYIHFDVKNGATLSIDNMKLRSYNADELIADDFEIHKGSDTIDVSVPYINIDNTLKPKKIALLVVAFQDGIMQRGSFMPVEVPYAIKDKEGNDVTLDQRKVSATLDIEGLNLGECTIKAMLWDDIFNMNLLKYKIVE